MRPQEDIDTEAYEGKQLDQMAKRGRAEADFVKAVRAARDARTAAGLDCYFDDEGVGRFTTDQGIRSAVYAREDAGATLMLQLMIMKRLDRHRRWTQAGVVILTLIFMKLL